MMIGREMEHLITFWPMPPTKLDKEAPVAT